MKNLSFNQQIVLVFLLSIGFTLAFSFFFIHHLYSELYLSRIEESIIKQGERTASHYHYGELSEEIQNMIEWYNIVSEYEVIVVENLDNLTAHFPYQIDYETLVNEQDRGQLEEGKYVLKKGFVEEFNREILGAIFPIKGEVGMIGFIYIYVPLAAIEDVFKNNIPLLLIVGVLFFGMFYFIFKRVWRSISRPLANLQQLAHEVSKGNYSNQVEIERKDEIGQLAEAFNQMSMSLQEQEERKKEFTSNVVHELRTPLTYIRGYSSALKQKIFTSPEEADYYLTTIEKEADRMNQLINDIVDLNQLQEDLYTIEKEPISIAQLLFDTIDLFTILIEEKELEWDLAVDEELIVSGDSQRLHQVFYNTIDNAIKYSNNGGTVSIKIEAVNDAVEYRINNEGTIIQKEDLPRIGERFFRTDRARNRATGGSGLGLSIVKEIVRLHSGTFSIESDESTGTTVTIRLPQWDMEGAE